METIKSMLFENPLYIYIALGLAVVVLAAIWFERRDTNLLKWMALPVLLAVVVFTVERLVVTDREQIHAITQSIAVDLEHGQVRQAASHMDDKGLGRWMTRELAIAAGESAIKTYGIRKVDLSNFDINVEGRFATMKVTSTIRMTSGEAAGQAVPLVWQLKWTKTGDQWKITQVDYEFGLK